MMKESSVVWVYILSLIVMLEEFSWAKTAIISGALFATSLTVNGEAHFVWAGFILQGAALMCSSVKTILQSLLLTGPGMRLDAPSYVLVVMPQCFALLAMFLFLTWVLPGPTHVYIPNYEPLYRWSGHIALSAVLATGLNFVIASLIRFTSAMGFVLAGIVKDGSIVCLGWLVFGETITSGQSIGFGLQILCVCAWALLKLSSNNGEVEGDDTPIVITKKPMQQDPEYGAIEKRNGGYESNAA